MKYFWPVATLVCVAIIILMRSCGSGGHGETPYPSAKRDTTIIHDTVTLKAYQPVAYEILKPGASQPVTPPHMVFIDFSKPVDTMAILEDYFTQRMYNDTLRNKYGYVVVHDTISQNIIWSRSADFNFSIPEVTNTITGAKRKGFIGFDLGIGSGLAMGGLQFTYVIGGIICFISGAISPLWELSFLVVESIGKFHFLKNSFMNKIITWLKTDNRWVLLFIIIPVFGYLLVSAFFPLNNFYSKSCQAVGWGWKIGGVAIMGAGVWIFKKVNNDFLAPIILFVFIALMIGAFAGFNFSA